MSDENQKTEFFPKDQHCRICGSTKYMPGEVVDKNPRVGTHIRTTTVNVCCGCSIEFKDPKIFSVSIPQKIGDER